MLLTSAMRLVAVMLGVLLLASACDAPGSQLQVAGTLNASSGEIVLLFEPCRNEKVQGLRVTADSRRNQDLAWQAEVEGSSVALDSVTLGVVPDGFVEIQAVMGDLRDYEWLTVVLTSSVQGTIPLELGVAALRAGAVYVEDFRTTDVSSFTEAARERCAARDRR